LHVSSVYSNLASVVFRADKSIHIWPAPADSPSEFAVKAHSGRMVAASDSLFVCLARNVLGTAFAGSPESKDERISPNARQAKIRVLFREKTPAF